MGENKYNVFPAWDISVLSKNKLSKNKDYHSGSLFAFFSLCCLLQILGSICLSPSTYAAHTATLTTSGTVNVDVSVSGTGASVAEDELTITSTCPLGYTVSISGPADRTLYRNGSSTNNTTEQTITASTGTVSSPASILGNNLGTWGYALGDNITTSSNFIGLASTASTLITKNTASATGGDTVSVYYGVSVHSNQVPGLYTMAESQAGAGDNVITYYLTTSANCDNYIIKYNDNNANSATTMTGMTHPVVENDEVTLAASNYQRNGYGFAGWSTVQLDPNSASFATNLQSAVNAGKVFGPNETITVNQALLNQAVLDGSTQVITMYAIWVKPATNPTTNQPETLQGWICPNNTNMPVGTVVALKDSRDNNTYAVAKLADGKCWMIENLRLDNTATLDSTNTNNPATGFALSTPQDPSTNPWCTDTTSACMDQSMLATNNTTNTVSNMTTTSQNIYSYGNYYNWYSATAGNGTTAVNSENTSVSGSICPAGWHLPSGGNGDNASSSNEYLNLMINLTGVGPNGTNTLQSRLKYLDLDGNNLGTTASRMIRSFPNNYLYSSAVNMNTEGLGAFWTSTVTGSAFTFSFVSNEVNPATNTTYKTDGRVVRCMANTYIQYDDNGANSPTTMGRQSVDYFADNITLWASNFKRSGYGFAGWNTKADGTGTKYGPNETIDDETVLNSIKNNGITFYAMWIQSAGNLQGWTCPNNTVMPIGTVTALTDTRDNDTYAIAKLADGKCWMIENLRLNNVPELSVTNTDRPSLPLTNAIDQSTGTIVSSSNHLSAHQDPNQSPWCHNHSASCDDQSMLRTSNTAEAVSVMTDPSQNIYSYGNYYNWYSATAGNGTYSTVGNNNSVAGSICPVGWHLPVGGNGNNAVASDYWQLGVATMGVLPNDNNRYFDSETDGNGKTATKSFRTYPNNFLYSGGGENVGNTNRGIGGAFWASTVYSNATSYGFVLFDSFLSPGTYNGHKYFGWSVRCIKSPIQDNMYMQDVTSYNVNDTEENISYTLKDRRDEKTYTVAKINGALWMTQNLRITGTISAAESNFTGADFNTCVSDLTTGTSYDEAKCHDSNNTTNGVWYNYASATAGTITGNPNTNDATEDICPAGWSLPYHDANASPGSAESILGAVTQFSPVIGGQYDSNLRNTATGFWWMASNMPTADRYMLQYDADTSLIVYDRGGIRNFGRYIRCVHL